jgi:hypothetical protein
MAMSFGPTLINLLDYFPHQEDGWNQSMAQDIQNAENPQFFLKGYSDISDTDENRLQAEQREWNLTGSTHEDPMQQEFIIPDLVSTANRDLKDFLQSLYLDDVLHMDFILDNPILQDLYDNVFSQVLFCPDCCKKPFEKTCSHIDQTVGLRHIRTEQFVKKAHAKIKTIVLERYNRNPKIEVLMKDLEIKSMDTCKKLFGNETKNGLQKTAAIEILTNQKLLEWLVTADFADIILSHLNNETEKDITTNLTSRFDLFFDPKSPNYLDSKSLRESLLGSDTKFKKPYTTLENMLSVFHFFKRLERFAEEEEVQSICHVKEVLIHLEKKIVDKLVKLGMQPYQFSGNMKKRLNFVKVEVRQTKLTYLNYPFNF